VAIKRRSTPLPPECRRLYDECAELLSLLDEQIALGVASGAEMQDAVELASILRVRCRQVRDTYYPDAPAISMA
jgi:hypothetical protein